jgi:hypothetical protein
LLSDKEVNKLLNPDNMRKLLCTVKERNITYKKHFLNRLDTRSKYNDFIPTDINEFKKMILNRNPALVLYANDAFQLFYNMNEEYDLIVILSVNRIKNPIKINFITLLPQAAYRRINKYGN